MRRCQFKFACISAMLACAASVERELVAQTISPDAKKAFIAEYTAAVERLQAGFARGRLRCHVARKRPKPTKGVDTHFQLEYAVQDDAHRLEMNNISGGVDPGGSTVYLLSGGGRAFGLERFSNTETYSIVDTTIQGDDVRTIVRDAVLPLHGPYSVNEGSVLEVLTKQGVVFRSIDDNVDPMDVRRVTVSFEGTTTSTHYKNPRFVGRFVFLPQRNWALESSTTTYSDDDNPLILSHQLRLQYPAESSNACLPVEVQSWVERGPEKKKGMVTVCSDITFVVDDVPEEEFTLAAFGIEDFEAGRSRRFWIFVYLLVIAAVAGTIATLIWRRLRHA